MLNEANIGLRIVQTLENEILGSLVADRLFRGAVVNIDICRTEAVVLALHFHHTILIDQTGVGEQLTEVEGEVAADEIHQEDAVASVDDEVRA